MTSSMFSFSPSQILEYSDLEVLNLFGFSELTFLDWFLNSRFKQESRNIFSLLLIFSYYKIKLKFVRTYSLGPCVFKFSLFIWKPFKCNAPLQMVFIEFKRDTLYLNSKGSSTCPQRSLQTLQFFLQI